jgi:hypothetical protein
MQHKKYLRANKRFNWRTFQSRLVYQQGGFRPVDKESQNGLENPEDRRSAGRHGNQHVYVRRPQVSGVDSFTLYKGGPPRLTRS